MCNACDVENPAARVEMPGEVIARARAIEAQLDGPAVSPDDWDVFEGRRGGALRWEIHHRLATALQMAMASRFFCQEAR